MLMDIRLVLCGVMLFVSAYFDLKSREVEDRLWWIFGALGLALTAAEALLGFNPNQLLMYLASTAVSGAVAFTLYYLGFYGGADAKALLVCALITPIFDRHLTIHPFTPLIILVNSTILTASLAIYYGLSNLIRILSGEKIFEGLEHEPIYRKALASIFGFRVKSKVGSFYFLMEKEECGKRRFNFNLLRVDEDFTSKEDVWVTPGIPLLAFMAAGFVVAVFFGDLLAYILKALVMLTTLL